MEKVRNQGIDILRGMACILVAIYHYYQFRGSYIAVVIFFALSGYLMTDSLLGKEMLYREYLKKKIVKLYPLLLLVIAVSAIGVYYFEGGFGEHFRYGALSSVFALSNIYQSFSKISYFEAHSEVLPLIHTWALSLEIQFYILFPLLLMLLQRWKRTEKEIAEVFFLLANLSALWMLIQYIRGIDLSRIYYGTDTRMFSFFLAAAIASYMKGKEVIKEKKYFVYFLALLGLVSVLIFIFYLDYTSQWNYLGGLYISSILISFTILACDKVAFLGNLSFVGKILARLGEHGYSYYLWQYVLMVFANEIFKWTRVPYHLSVGSQVLLLILLSEASYYIVERRKFSFSWILAFASVLLAVLLFVPKATTEDLNLMQEAVEDTSINEVVETETPEKEAISPEKKVETEKIPDNQLAGILTPPKEEVEAKALEHTSVEKEQKVTEEKEEKISPSTEGTEVEENSKKIISTGHKYREPITFIGDSVMKMAEGDIHKRFPNAYIDAKVSRQFLQLPEILNHLKAQGNLHQRVVIHLGSNGPIREKSYQKVKEMLQGHEVYFMNAVVAKSWESDVNALLAKETAKEESFHLIDWYSYAKGQAKWFYKDATHPKPNGAKKYVDFILQEVEK